MRESDETGGSAITIIKYRLQNMIFLHALGKAFNLSSKAMTMNVQFILNLHFIIILFCCCAPLGSLLMTGHRC